MYNFNGQTFKNREISLFIDHSRILSSRFNFENTWKSLKFDLSLWVHHQFNDEDNIVNFYFLPLENFYAQFDLKIFIVASMHSPITILDFSEMK